MKAYGNGVQQALKQLALAQKVPEAEYILQCDYAQLALVENLLQQTAGRILQGEYGAAVVLHLALPTTEVELFGNKLRDLSRGNLQLTPISQ